MNTQYHKHNERTEILEYLGDLIEKAREKNDLTKLKELIYKTLKHTDDPKFNLREKGLLHYFLGNAWSYIQRIKFPGEEFPLETVELENQIIHLRIAYNFISQTDDDFNKCQILTNLGNLFSHIGRFSESQSFYNKCLEIDKNFGMAIGNRGFGLYYYARVIFEPTQQFIFMQYARRDLLRAISSNQVYNEAKIAFTRMIQNVEKAYPLSELNNLKSYKDFYKNLNKNEKAYRYWCAENKLFINPLNDLFTESVVSNDFLFIPSMVLKPKEKFFYHSMFNQLKQEYSTARFLFYEGIQINHPHYADKEVTLMDTLDYSVYSIHLEKVKISYRVCYSLFDKIAYFINIYLNLGLKKDRVTFRTVWYDNLSKKKGLNSKLQETKNWAMRGLFWLSKDFYEETLDRSIEPEAKEIALIRNFIEHKSFKIVESGNYNWIDKTETLEIDRSLFYDKTFKLLELARSSIMYLSFLVYDEEREKQIKNPNQRPIPINFRQIEDNEKI